MVADEYVQQQQQPSSRLTEMPIVAGPSRLMLRQSARRPASVSNAS